ncbi:MAG: site-specific integrase [Cyanobacteria bacterium]|nr:site-specific integrase [Cyanobacteriota bacterium]
MPTLNGSGQATVLSNEQIDKIIKIARSPYKIIFAIAAFTGCRISEAIKLTAENLDLENGTILFTETKTKVDRQVPIHPELLELLINADLPRSGFMFPSPKTDKAISRQCVSDELKQISQDLGFVGVSTHSFRRSLSTNLHEKGVDLKSIASITGHKSLDQLSKYIEVSP